MGDVVVHVMRVLVLVGALGCGSDVGVSTPPVVAPLQLTTLEDSPVSATLVVTDGDGDAITIGTLGPLHGTATQDGVELTYAPARDFNGRDVIVVIASDGTNETRSTITIDVAPVNDPPMPSDDAFTIDEDTSITLDATQLTANDRDADGEALTVTAISGATDGDVSFGSGVVGFAPRANFAGTAGFDYTVSDGATTATGHVAIIVNVVDDPPVAVDDTLLGVEDVALVIGEAQLGGNDLDIDNDTLSITSVGNPTHCTVTISGGAITFTPEANYVGTATFDYAISDGVWTDEASVSVELAPVDDAPVAYDDTATTRDATALMTANKLLFNDVDVDGPGLVVTSVQAATHGTVALVPCLTTTCVLFTPDTGYVGPAQFEYTVTSGGATDTGTVFVNVTPAWGGAVRCARRAGSSDIDSAAAIAGSADGGSLVAGYYTAGAVFGAGEPTETTIAQSGFFLARYNLDCTLAWVRPVIGPTNGGFTNNGGVGLAVRGDSVYVAATFRGSAVFAQGLVNETTLTTASSVAEAFVAAYRADGEFQWVERVVATQGVQALGLSALDDRVYVLSYFGGQVTFAPGEPGQITLASAKPASAIARYSPTGGLVSARALAVGAYAAGIAALPDGSTLVTGNFAGTVTFGAGEPNETTLTSTDRQLLIARYAEDGTLAWAKRGTTGGGSVYGFQLAATPDGASVLVAGTMEAEPGMVSGRHTFGLGEPTQTNVEYNGFYDDAFLARYATSDGALVWAKAVTYGVYDDGALAVAATSDGGAVIAGWFGAPSGGATLFGRSEDHWTRLDAVDPHDMYIAKYSANGTLVWARHAGGGGAQGNNEPMGVAIAPDGRAMVTGRFDGNATFGLGHPSATQLSSAGHTDIFVATFDP